MAVASAAAVSANKKPQRTRVKLKYALFRRSQVLFMIARSLSRDEPRFPGEPHFPTHHTLPVVWLTLTCCHHFWHINHVTLERSTDAPSVPRCLPCDSTWRATEVSLERNVTSGLEIDVIKRQGVATVLEKVEKVGAESVQRIIECYINACQARARLSITHISG